MLQDVPTMLGGRYRVVERIGRGGMADVYRAEDVVLRRDVAIKIFRGGLEREHHLARFRAEVRTLARLTHPHLVALYDAGGEVTEPWCAMEYVDGGSLADREEEAQDPGLMARVGAQVAEALAHVHDRGIVHRDVKPSNVLLDTRGGAFLSDFGIARLVDGTRMTQSGLMIGTAAFLSPEQVRGRTAGPPADVYALGLVLLEGLTGRREYPGSPVESAVARLSRPPAVPDDLAAPWAELLTAMTLEDPDGRPSAADVRARLAAVVRGLPAVPHMRPTPAGRPASPPATPAASDVAEAREDAAAEDAAAAQDAVAPEDAAALQDAVAPEDAPAAEDAVAPQAPDGGDRGDRGDRPTRTPADLILRPPTPGLPAVQLTAPDAGPAGLDRPVAAGDRRRAVTLLVGAGVVAAVVTVLPMLDAGSGAVQQRVAPQSQGDAGGTSPSASPSPTPGIGDDLQPYHRAPVPVPEPEPAPFPRPTWDGPVATGRAVPVYAPVRPATPRTPVRSASPTGGTPSAGAGRTPVPSPSASPSPSGSSSPTSSPVVPTTPTPTAGASPTASSTGGQTSTGAGGATGTGGSQGATPDAKPSTSRTPTP